MLISGSGEREKKVSRHLSFVAYRDWCAAHSCASSSSLAFDPNLIHSMIEELQDFFFMSL